jgi:hypothetical protein
VPTQGVDGDEQRPGTSSDTVVVNVMDHLDRGQTPSLAFDPLGFHGGGEKEVGGESREKRLCGPHFAVC